VLSAGDRSRAFQKYHRWREAERELARQRQRRRIAAAEKAEKYGEEA
jgi:hypothetical protein